VPEGSSSILHVRLEHPETAPKGRQSSRSGHAPGVMGNEKVASIDPGLIVEADLSRAVCGRYDPNRQKQVLKVLTLSEVAAFADCC
jgi:hypothetical protein